MKIYMLIYLVWIIMFNSWYKYGMRENWFKHLEFSLWITSKKFTSNCSNFSSNLVSSFCSKLTNFSSIFLFKLSIFCSCWLNFWRSSCFCWSNFLYKSSKFGSCWLNFWINFWDRFLASDLTHLDKETSGAKCLGFLLGSQGHEV